MSAISFLFYRVFAYIYLIIFYINQISESDEIVANFVNIHDNLFVQIFSILLNLSPNKFFLFLLT